MCNGDRLTGYLIFLHLANLDSILDATYFFIMFFLKKIIFVLISVICILISFHRESILVYSGLVIYFLDMYVGIDAKSVQDLFYVFIGC